MERIFFNSNKLGDGYFCSSDQFEKSYAIEFYDGILEGIMLVGGSNYIVHVKKIWWDSEQDNRLFECTGVPFEFLSENKSLLMELFDSKTSTAKYNAHLVTKADKVKAAILESPKPIVFYVFCKSLRDEIFILPSEPELDLSRFNSGSLSHLRGLFFEGRR